jgi:hypothetical protein
MEGLRTFQRLKSKVNCGGKLYQHGLSLVKSLLSQIVSVTPRNPLFLARLRGRFGTMVRLVLRLPEAREQGWTGIWLRLLRRGDPSCQEN